MKPELIHKLFIQKENYLKKWSTFVFAGASVLALSACGDDHPATKAEAKADQKEDQAQSATEKAKDKIEDAVDATADAFVALTDEAKAKFASWTEKTKEDLKSSQGEIDKLQADAKAKTQEKYDQAQTKYEETKQRFEDYRKAGENDREASKQKFVDSYQSFKESLKAFKDSLAHPSAQ